jgi:hypothetical protein
LSPLPDPSESTALQSIVAAGAASDVTAAEDWIVDVTLRAGALYGEPVTVEAIAAVIVADVVA